MKKLISLSLMSFIAVGCSASLPYLPQSGHMNTAPMHSTSPAVFDYFKYSVVPSFRLQEATENVSGVRRKGEKNTEFGLDNIYIMFDESVSTDEVRKIFKEFKVKNHRREVLPASPDGSIPEKTTNNFWVEFDADSQELTTFESDALKWGFTGEFEFSDSKGASAFAAAAKIHANKVALKVRHIGFNITGVENTATYMEGHNVTTNTYTQTPNQPVPSGQPCDYHGHWFHGAYQSGCTGNKINWSGGSVWDLGYRGGAVKVAVVDSNFLFSQEGPNQALNPAIYGNFSASAWTYDTVNNSYQLNVPTGSGTYHGRAMSSLIFGRHNDYEGTAGIAPDAFPILLHTQDASNFTSNPSSKATAINIARSWGAEVINMSWATPNPTGWPITAHGFYQPIVDANAAGIVCVASTGNNHEQYTVPAMWGECMGVSAHDRNGYVAWFSTPPNGTQAANTMYADIYAAGTSVNYISNANTNNFPYVKTERTHSGTSGSAAVISGICALLAQKHGGAAITTATATAKLRAAANLNSLSNPAEAGYGFNRPTRYILDAVWTLLYY